ncbi:hypothetical protein CASFOL_031230 [Castilleja foliolosa]|uniref:Uncharacterized protein n=1 Tax=Castilleja foliolosa TaxID=1961234 RepID=A0ABD3C4T9_9LAMI
MQAIKEKLSDMSAMRQAKAEAREEEKAEKELAKTRIQVAHEVRMAREAEAAMDLHVNKAAEKAIEHERKYQKPIHGGVGEDTGYGQESYARNPCNSPTGGSGYLTDPTCRGGSMDPTAGSADGTDYASTRSVGAPPYSHDHSL